MSLTFSNIVSLINSNTKANSSSYPIAEKVIDINVALDKVWDTILPNMGTWQLDDSNHTDYPILTTNLVSGQRDYSFTADSNSNLILEIYKVMVADSSGKYYEIFPVDVQSETDTSTLYDGQNTGGKPIRYDKTANGIFLDPIPDYSYTAGLKIYVNREASYFTVSDTTKKPGFAGIYHEYLALRPSYMYAMRNGLANVNVLKQEMLEMEKKIEAYYADRSRDEKPTLRAQITNYD